MDEVKLMNRVDRKFCVNTALLPDLLEQIVDDYYILDMDGVRLFKYTNTYFDTRENSMYNDHVRGRKTRFKIRQRAYVESQSSYFEIKFKNNKGKTFKSRVAYAQDEDLFSDKITRFLEEHSPFTSAELQPVLENAFMRLTLVSKKLDERCTIDYGVLFQGDGSAVELDQIAIVEVKTEGYSKHSKLVQTLRENNFRPNSFSKYVVGRSMLDHRVKNNAYRSKLRQIEKISKTTF